MDLLHCLNSYRSDSGNVAERLELRTCNSEAPSSSPALTTSWIGSRRPKFDSSITFVNSQLVRLRPVGIVNPFMFDLIDSFQLFARPH